MREAGHTTAVVFSVMMLVLGIGLIGRTVLAGGGALSVGVVLGVLFVLAGAGRLYVARRLGRRGRRD